jgi:hypothetical protein
MTGIGTTPIVKSIVQDVLDNTIQRRNPPAGLNYAAFAIQTYPSDANGGTKLKLVSKSCNTKHLERLLSRFSGPASTPDEQVLLWEELLPKLHDALIRMDGDLFKVGQGANVRVVLDVDMGGFFYDRINSNTILFGATLDQLQVNNGQCDKEMRQMVSEIQAVFTAHGA